jgi:hypothetical protein
MVDAMEQRTQDILAVVVKLLVEDWPVLSKRLSAECLPDLRQEKNANEGECPLGSDRKSTESGHEWQQQFARTYRVVASFVRRADGIVAAGRDPTDGPHEHELINQLYEIFCRYTSRAYTNGEETPRASVDTSPPSANTATTYSPPSATPSPEPLEPTQSSHLNAYPVLTGRPRIPRVTARLWCNGPREVIGGRGRGSGPDRVQDRRLLSPAPLA